MNQKSGICQISEISINWKVSLSKKARLKSLKNPSVIDLEIIKTSINFLKKKPMTQELLLLNKETILWIFYGWLMKPGAAVWIMKKDNLKVWKTVKLSLSDRTWLKEAICMIEYAEIVNKDQEIASACLLIHIGFMLHTFCKLGIYLN